MPNINNNKNITDSYLLYGIEQLRSQLAKVIYQLPGKSLTFMEIPLHAEAN